MLATRYRDLTPPHQHWNIMLRTKKQITNWYQHRFFFVPINGISLMAKSTLSWSDTTINWWSYTVTQKEANWQVVKATEVIGTLISRYLKKHGLVILSFRYLNLRHRDNLEVNLVPFMVCYDLLDVSFSMLVKYYFQFLFHLKVIFYLAKLTHWRLCRP